MVFQPMTIKEISRGGAQIETGFPLHLDSLHEFRLTLGERSIIVKARVAHCSISDVEQEIVLYRSGIEFVEPSERVDDHHVRRRRVLRGSGCRCRHDAARRQEWSSQYHDPCRPLHIRPLWLGEGR